MFGTIIEDDRKIVIAGDWYTLFDKPVERRNIWPTGLRFSDWDHLTGKRVKYDNGCWMLWGDTSRLRIEMPEGGRTKSIRCEERAVKQRTREVRHDRREI